MSETDEYFVFLFDNNHAQLYDKKTLKGGTEAEFREFIIGKIGMGMLYVK